MANMRTAAARRSHTDGIAWATIDAHIPPLRPEGYRSSRPSNYQELWEAVQAYQPHPNDSDAPPWMWPAFEHAWSNFLHEFFYWRLADFFAVPPSAELGPERCAMLAGSAEYLCHRYDLDVPEWVADHRFQLPHLQDFYPENPATRFARCQRAAPEFLSLNLIFEARNLITL